MKEQILIPNESQPQAAATSEYHLSVTLSLLALFCAVNNLSGEIYPGKRNGIIKQEIQKIIGPVDLKFITPATDENQIVVKIAVPIGYKEVLEQGLNTLKEMHCFEITESIKNDLCLAADYYGDFSRVIDILLKGTKWSRYSQTPLVIALNTSDDAAKLKSYIRQELDLSPAVKEALKLKAAQGGCKATDFKACCDHLKIVFESKGFLTTHSIVISELNLMELYRVTTQYRVISPALHNFLKLQAGEQQSKAMEAFKKMINTEIKEGFVVSNNLLAECWKETIPSYYKSYISGRLIRECVIRCDTGQILDISEAKEIKGVNVVRCPDFDKARENWKKFCHFVEIETETRPILPLQCSKSRSSVVSTDSFFHSRPSSSHSSSSSSSSISNSSSISSLSSTHSW